MLSCFHAFCKDCLQQKANNPQSPSTTSCPVCGQTTQVNGGFTASLPLFCFLKLDEAKNKLMRDRRCAIYMNLKHTNLMSRITVLFVAMDIVKIVIQNTMLLILDILKFL